MALDKNLNSIWNMTNQELGKVDAKFRNLGTVSSLMIASMVGIIVYALNSQTGAAKIWIVSLALLFIAFNATAILISMYAIWPRRRYANSPYDIHFISKKKYLSLDDLDDRFSEKNLKKIIRINGAILRKKTRLLKAGILFTFFPFSLFVLVAVKIVDSKWKKKYYTEKRKAQEKKQKKDLETLEDVK